MENVLMIHCSLSITIEMANKKFGREQTNTSGCGQQHLNGKIQSP